MAAAQWAAELDDEAMPRDRRNACEAWCAEHPAHRLALDRIRGLETRLANLDPAEREAVARATKQRHRSRIAGGAFSLGFIAIAGWFGAQSFAVRQYFPDYRTAPGVQQNAALPDGSHLTIDTNSAVAVAMTTANRNVRLFEGQLLITVARDAARPFIVETRDGTATALGTAFIVRQNDNGSVVSVIESHVRVCATGIVHMVRACTVLEPGERAGIANGTIKRLGRIDPRQATAWTRGWLEVDDRPLAEILDELNRYRAHPIRFDAGTLADLHITGSYPLTDTSRALNAIAEAVGLNVSGSSDEDILVTRE